ncbi:hypothetical protein ACOME3_007050 [Neoechinorhynchus agilis]
MARSSVPLSDLRIERIKKVVIVLDIYNTSMCPLTSTLPVALWPVASKPLIVHSLDQLMRSGLRNIILVCTRYMDEIKGVIDNAGFISKLMRIDYVLAGNARNVGDALRELDTRGALGTDSFLLFDTPFISNAVFDCVFDDFHCRVKDKNAIGLVYLASGQHKYLNESSSISVKMSSITKDDGKGSGGILGKLRRFDHRGQWSESGTDEVSVEYRDLDEH